MEDRTDRTADPLVDETEEERRSSAAARLFDIRRVIGGLFAIYGLIVTAIGIFDSPAELKKAQGVRINLWAGLAMLAFGLAFLFWQWRRPAEAPAGATDADAGGEGPAGDAGDAGSPPAERGEPDGR
jgi:hypothetical protein